MSGHHRDFVAFDLASERDFGLPLDEAFAKLRCHFLNIVTVQIKFLGNLFIREIQSQEIQADDPDPPRLVVAGEERPSQVVEAFATGVAFGGFSTDLGYLNPAFGNVPETSPESVAHFHAAASDVISLRMV